jgi:peptide/nickel transport system permease protein
MPLKRKKSHVFKDSRIIFSFSIISIFIFSAIFGPLLLSQGIQEGDLSLKLCTPYPQHPFGCDLHGQDVLTEMILGSRISLYIAFFTVLLSTTIGIAAGLVSGFYKGFLDMFIMRFVDILMAFPGILLALSLSSLLGPSLHNLIISITATGWTSTARLVRGQVLSLSEREYVVAAKAIGASSFRTLVLHILPSLTTPLLVSTSFSLSGVILVEASLSFLGLGAQGETPSWGALLNQGRSALSEAPHLSIFPGTAILLVVLAFNFLGDALRDHLDPKQFKK